MSLSTTERAFVVAAVRVLRAGAADFLRRYGEAKLAAAQPLITDEGARAREAARLGAFPPEGIERVHPSWWVSPPASSRPAARAYLERAAMAHLVPMPPAPWSPGTPLTGLESLSSDALVELLLALGRRRVATAFANTPRESLAELCSRLGEPAASELMAEVRRLQPSHDEARAAQRALFKLTVEAPDARALFTSAGARWIGPALLAQGGDLLQRVAQRLPLRLGSALLAEAGAAATDADHRFCIEALTQLAR